MVRIETKRRGALVQSGDATTVPVGALGLNNLSNCIEEARQAVPDGDAGPPDPTEFKNLRGRLEPARTKLPPVCREAVFRPYVQTLNKLAPRSASRSA